MYNLRTNEDRLWTSMMDMAAIGALPAGGCCRLALSADDGRGRDLFVDWCKQAGCSVHYDQVGNIFARRPGKDNALPPVAVGSHLDTQPHGGKFDGVYGVLAGLEVIRTMNEHSIETDLPVELIVWTNEEGARFVPAITGSSAFAGILDAAEVHAVKTYDDTNVGEDLRAIGYMGDEIPGGHVLDSFFEAHIEQGPMLENEELTIGVVGGVNGMFDFAVSVTGQDGHAGTVPTSERRDAMMATGRMISWLQDFVASVDDALRLTVGYLKVTPNAPSTIPGQVDFSIDIRHPDAAVLDHCKQAIPAKFAELAEAGNVDLSVECVFDLAPVKFDETIRGSLEQATKELGYPYTNMHSGAGHDAMNIARVAPTAMIFVPCEKGISHNEAESATPGDLAAGADVLLHAILKRANST